MPIAIIKRLHVWRNVKDVVLDDIHEQFVICPHHPDRLRRPSPRPEVLHAERSPITTALVHRYGRSRNGLTLRSGPRAGAMANVRSVGLTRWIDLAAILQDCEHAQVLSEMERALARNALRWLARVNIVAREPI
jgi:hypothetical protein